MRIRYIRIRDYPPIRDLEIALSSAGAFHHQAALRFVVGINGSGKSNFLRAIAEVFLALSDGRVPPFALSMVYELGQPDSSNHRTLVLDSMGGRSRASLWIREHYSFVDDFRNDDFAKFFEVLQHDGRPPDSHFVPLIARGDWPQLGSTLPSVALPIAVLAYTTGDQRPWLSVWNRGQSASGAFDRAIDDDVDSDERPAGWTMARERAIESQSGASHEDDSPASLALAEPSQYRRPILIDATLLKCALLAVVLSEQTSSSRRPHDPKSADPSEYATDLEDPLSRAGWRYLATVGFHVNFTPTTWPPMLRAAAIEWWRHASTVIATPHPTEARRWIYFDVGAALQEGAAPNSVASSESGVPRPTRGDALWRLLGGDSAATPYDVFVRLLDLSRMGLFDDLVLRLRRTRPDYDGEEIDSGDAGLLRYEELSDGEQSFLGRTALFSLLKDQADSILLLDEPETHFNDVWKRDVVAYVDDALHETAAEVWIATHAALMLTDALRDELVILERPSRGEDGRPEATKLRIPDGQFNTFGATGDHPLRDVFGAAETVGRRASRVLDVLLAASRFASEIDAAWATGSQFRPELLRRIREHLPAGQDQLSDVALSAELGGLLSHAKLRLASAPATFRDVLEYYIANTGPGYFRIELKRAWHHLQQESNHAA